MKTRKLLAGILTFAMILGCLILPVTVSADAIGISDAAGLAAISSSGSYALTKDIDLGGAEWTPISTFSGTLNGNGHTISNFKIDAVTNGIERAGLFGTLTGATVTDLKFSNVTVTGMVEGYNANAKQLTAGVLAGYVSGAATISKICVDDTCKVSGGMAGGIVGVMMGGTLNSISYCYNAASVTAGTVADMFAGGITAVAANTSVSYCENVGTIGTTAASGTNVQIGGIVGRAGWGSAPSVSYSVNKGAVNACHTGGGLMGVIRVNGTSAENCVSLTSFGSGLKDWSGMLGGRLYNTATFTSCYYLTNATYGATGANSTNVNNATLTTCTAAASAEDEGLKTLLGSIETEIAQKLGLDGAPAVGWDGVTKTEPVGAGTEAEPYLISRPEELAWFSGADTNKFMKITADLDLNGKTFQPIGVVRGSLDGDGHTISNFSVTAAVSGRVGLIGAVAGGKVRNLTVDNATVKGASNGNGGIGAIAGFVNGTALLSHLTVGENVTVTETAGSEVATDYVGGVAGYVQTAATVEYCVNYGTVTSTGEGTGSIGGVIGFSQAAANITYCANYGSVVAPASSKTQYAGGIVGQMRTATVSNCLNAGSVKGSHIVGGIAAYSYTGNAGKLNNCVNASTEIAASGDWMGGLLGRLDGTVTATGCFTVTSGSLGAVAKSSSTANYTLTDLTTDETEANAAIVANAAKNLANAVANGTEVNAITEGVNLFGYQKTEVKDGKYGIRFLATVDDYSAYTKISFQVANADASHFYEVPVNTVYTALLETVDGDKIYKEAWELNGNFLAAYSITDIDEAATFEILVAIVAETADHNIVHSAYRYQVANGEVTVTPYAG